jgi:uncharacterized membrane protein YdjX (TVP38/TMEM64 family)
MTVPAKRSGPAAVECSRKEAPLRGRLLTAAAIGAVMLAGFVAWRWIEAAGGAESQIARLGSWAPLVSIPAHALLAATPFPSELVGVANGTVYGLWLGTLYAWIGWWCGAVLEYAMVRLGARQINLRSHRFQVPAWLQRFPVDHPLFLIVGRQLPFGFHAVNVAAGLSRVSAKRQVICAGIANLPYAFVTASVGAGLASGLA